MSTDRCLSAGFEEEDCEGQDLLEAGRESEHTRPGQAQRAGETQPACVILSRCSTSLHIKGIRLGCRFSRQRYLLLAAPTSWTKKAKGKATAMANKLLSFWFWH